MAPKRANSGVAGGQSASGKRQNISSKRQDAALETMERVVEDGRMQTMKEAVNEEMALSGASTTKCYAVCVT